LRTRFSSAKLDRLSCTSALLAMVANTKKRSDWMRSWIPETV
jgi:hypothetical protein